MRVNPHPLVAWVHFLRPRPVGEHQGDLGLPRGLGQGSLDSGLVCDSLRTEILAPCLLQCAVFWAHRVYSGHSEVAVVHNLMIL